MCRFAPYEDACPYRLVLHFFIGHGSRTVEDACPYKAVRPLFVDQKSTARRSLLVKAGDDGKRGAQSVDGCARDAAGVAGTLACGIDQILANGGARLAAQNA